MEYIIAIGLIVLVVILYAFSYAVNEKTSVPAGCEDLTDLSSCGACTNGGCSIKKTIEVDAKNVQQ